MKALLLKLVRNGLGQLIVFINFITRPKPLARTTQEQALVEEQVQALSLYQFTACPFCVKVRRNVHRLNLPLALRDINKNPQYRQELQQQGGRVKVPCLRIQQDGEDSWLYESSDIIAYLEKRFGQSVDAQLGVQS